MQQYNEMDPCPAQVITHGIIGCQPFFFHKLKLLNITLISTLLENLVLFYLFF